jgi:hypothetical protein
MLPSIKGRGSTEMVLLARGSVGKEAPLAQSSNTIYISGTKPFIFLVSFGKPNLRFIFIKIA